MTWHAYSTRPYRGDGSHRSLCGSNGERGVVVEQSRGAALAFFCFVRADALCVQRIGALELALLRRQEA